MRSRDARTRAPHVLAVSRGAARPHLLALKPMPGRASFCASLAPSPGGAPASSTAPAAAPGAAGAPAAADAPAPAAAVADISSLPASSSQNGVRCRSIFPRGRQILKSWCRIWGCAKTFEGAAIGFVVPCQCFFYQLHTRALSCAPQWWVTSTHAHTQTRAEQRLGGGAGVWAHVPVRRAV